MSGKTRSEARVRNFSKFKLIGIHSWMQKKVDNADSMQVTEDEVASLTKIIILLEDMLDKFEVRSTELGFSDVGRRVGENRSGGII